MAQYLDTSVLYLQSVSEWTHSQVIDWMTSRNLFSFIESFTEGSISGAQLVEMTDSSLLVCSHILYIFAR